ncbi:uncharacterized protein SPAPADRAFT_61144 [Spathaspora passalidarum NRRL Y-27907]|uniref:Protein NBA1 n=1 Tax=Spathaspora passalidarum (strain NRRL Y-27907 / 11-Y1) TaxID=619300 RepID=G3AP19_SPAPN|nr:uncharacterized protein SPAPADRAFT_61144 [Spathaspora passalidarum NRRL Y-27907]EGW32050.1 hypothetical protein SPAPADRAFT_61144 [Spathaspora passalidarum NRRL Y-27907]
MASKEDLPHQDTSARKLLDPTTSTIPPTATTPETMLSGQSPPSSPSDAPSHLKAEEEANSPSPPSVPSASMKPPALPFTSPTTITSPSPDNNSKFRESIMSTMSQYSGLPSDEAATKVHIFSSNKVRYVTDEDDQHERERKHEHDFEHDLEHDHDNESIKLGKLVTRTSPVKEESPSMTYLTSVKEAIPARSPRRPLSVPPDSMPLDLSHSLPGPKRHSMVTDMKRRSIQINDGLEKLMHDAHSITSEEPEALAIKPTISAQTEPIPPKSDLTITKTRETSLPPRPTLDNIRRARDFSNSLQKQSESENAESDEYYDIEPEIQTKAKPVHKAITHKKKKKKNKQLPFSYTTLVNLLQSMNGTVIGEEFNQLHIPAQEKQLISQIIDSLSKLTSDMILDETRYEIGIKRLQLALNVLEGFT